jgi:predicted transcriptional regulator
LSERYAYILLTAEKWWNRRCNQRNSGKIFQAFVRHGSVGPLSAEVLLFYVKNPVREILGKAEFVERVTGNAEELWNKYGEETVFESYDEYKEFMGDQSKATFIRFKNLHELEKPTPLKDILQKLGKSALARSGKYISQEMVSILTI